MIEKELVVILGAGLSGRGYLARQLDRKQQKLVFVDQDRELIRRLNEQGNYRISFFGNKEKEIVVDDYEAFYIDHPKAKERIAEASYLFICVGAKNLDVVGRYLAEIFTEKSHPYILKGIIVAENGVDNLKRLKKRLSNHACRMTECLMLCTTIGCENSLNIQSEDLDYLPYNGDIYERTLPFAGFERFINYRLWAIRKIYTYNSLSAGIAYLGALKGYEVYGEAANDREIFWFTEKMEKELNQAICKEYGVDPGEQKHFSEMAKNKFRNREIRDTVSRNARSVRRKLSQGERIMGPLQLTERHGLSGECLEITAAAALCYGIRNGELTEPRQTNEAELKNWLKQIPEIGNQLNDQRLISIAGQCRRLFSSLN